ncbi:MAG: hypothetical protein JRI66_10685 [Deltaproteobacteria bacterium]|nr:hypothetical protein [Deltaproteobacteria bacterium]
MKKEKRTITSEEFNNILVEIIGETDPIVLLRIPGVYEILSEHFNNEVLERWEQENLIDEVLTEWEKEGL